MRKIKATFHIVILAISLLIIILITPSCRDSHSGYMLFDKVVKIGNFPLEVSPKAGHKVVLGKPGVMDVKLLDTVILFTFNDPEHYLSAFSTKDYHFIGSFLRKGNGPGEVQDLPFMSDLTFKSIKGLIHCYLYLYYGRGTMYDIDLDHSIAKSQTCFFGQKDSLPKGLSTCIPIDIGSFYCRTNRSNDSGLYRFVYTSGKEITDLNLVKLNDMHFNKRDIGINHNYISSFTTINESNHIAVEAAFYQDLINFFSIDGNFCKSVCTGDNIRKISDFQKIPLSSEIKQTYEDIRGYDDFVACLRNQSMTSSMIQIFDWQGNPKMSINIPHRTTCFDIDFKRGKIFTVNYENEEVWSYEVPELSE